MDKIEFEFKKKLIKENFKDERPIKCPTPEHITRLDDDVHPGGDIFTTEDGEFIDLEFQKEDFDEVELAKYIEFAENLYEKHHKKVSVYIICPKEINVCVREHRIISDGDFTIKIACSQEDFSKMILDIIKRKIRNKELLDREDLIMVEKLPLMCAKKDRKYYRVESLKIINRYFY
jgi:hypothetical protein